MAWHGLTPMLWAAGVGLVHPPCSPRPEKTLLDLLDLIPLLSSLFLLRSETPAPSHPRRILSVPHSAGALLRAASSAPQSGGFVSLKRNTDMCPKRRLRLQTKEPTDLAGSGALRALGTGSERQGRMP